jgi:hypothetical protein
MRNIHVNFYFLMCIRPACGVRLERDILAGTIIEWNNIVGKKIIQYYIEYRVGGPKI